MSSAYELEDDDFTYEDILKLDDGVRAEIIDGVLYMMSPPGASHQRILMRLANIFYNFLEGKTCEAFIAPFGVRLFPKPDKSDRTYLEPDLIVVCDPKKISEEGCEGAPDLIIEVLSPSNRRRGLLEKYNLYLKAKVKEYWVIYPKERVVEVNLYKNDRYFAQDYGFNEPGIKERDRVPETIPVSVLPGFEINVKDIFKN